MDKKSKKETVKIIKKKYELLSSCLNERSRRIWATSEAMAIGKGGKGILHKATGMDYKTIAKGFFELGKKEDERLEMTRIRKRGAGRKPAAAKDKTLQSDLEKLLEPATRGDPRSPLRWTCKSTRNLERALNGRKYRCSHSLIARELKSMGYSLQANRKTDEGGHHPDRNGQFEFINSKTETFLSEKQPVISVDTKKKENLGNFKNNGREYRPKGEPAKVKVYDFTDKKLGKAVPYGVYEIMRNKGWVNVGLSADTAEFSVGSIGRWWEGMGKKAYPDAKKLFINADGGGSNGYRVRLWKTELQKLATKTDLVIHISHFPPGTSKWNKIEHRMFSFISKNWRGKPLLDMATVVNLISSTKTEKGLEIKACIDYNTYEKGIKVSDEELDAVKLKKEEFHGEWNYIISPET